MAGPAPVVAARGVSKAFFGNPVLRDVSVELIPGRIHALLGENGAGKSTLINVVSGALRPDSGTIEIDGRALPHLGPAEARRAGIAVVHQELSLSAHLSIAENVGLGAYPRKAGFVDYSELSRRVQAACERVGLAERPETPVGELSLGRRQLVEIAKALYRRPRVLILDEPTSSLSAHEAETLKRLLQSLRDEGTALLYISHRLNEVLALCDYVTVLKDGTRTADQRLAGVDPAGLVRLMVGRDPGDLFPGRVDQVAAAPALVVDGLHAGIVRDATLSVRAGEIVGIGGLVGQGQEDFLLGLYGAVHATARSVTIGGAPGLPASPVEATRRGIVYVPADRKNEALLLIHSIGFNLLLPSLGQIAKGWLRDRRREAETARALASRLAIRGDLKRPVQALSGGNQQKVALAKWMPRTPSIFLLNDPTRGVDVETKREIYVMLRNLARDGKTIVLLSSDAPELVHLCDRVAVFREGRIAAMLERDQLSEEAIVAASMGVVPSQAAA